MKGPRSEGTGAQGGAAGLPQVASLGNPCLDHGCSACCHDIEMLLTQADLERITARLRAEGRDLDVHFVADDGYLQLRTRDGPPAAGGQGRPCILLDPSGRCSVHDVRPEGCRLYPAAWDEGLRQAILDEDYCPHTDGFRLQPETDGALRRLADRLESERRARMAGPGPFGHA